MFFKLLYICLIGSTTTALFSQTKSEAPAVEASAMAIDPAYLLAGGDEISLSVYGEPSLSTSVIIDRSGNVRIPLLGELKIMGLTVRAVESLIEQTYVSEEILKAPEITVRMKAYAVRELIVLGAVRVPGPFRFPLDTTSIDIRDLFSRLGGFTPVARGDAVTVTRKGVDGKETIETVDVQRMMFGRSARDTNIPTFLVYPGDRIFVPERIF